MKRDPILIAYNALMAIGCVNSDYFPTPEAALERTHDIANTAICELNYDHTRLIQQALFPDLVEH